MKIGYIADASSIHVIRWANAMADRGHEVVVMTCGNNAPENAEQYGKGARVITLKFPTPYGYYLNARQLKKTVKRENFDVLNVHYASGYGTLGRLAGLKNALLNVWGSDIYDFPNESKLKYRIIKKNLSYFSHLASTSVCMAKEAKKIVDRDFYVTPFGVDAEKFRPKGDKPQDKIVFGTVKTLKPKYGIKESIEAFIKTVERLKAEKNPLADKLFYEIYGKGEQEEELKNLVGKKGYSDRILFKGYVLNDLLPDIYNRFSAFAVNSFKESFGVAAVEAMASGLPVAASDADGFKEVVEDKVTGLIAPRGDVDALSENMYILATDEELRKKMGEAGRERAEKYFRFDKNVIVMEKIYEDMVKER